MRLDFLSNIKTKHIVIIILIIIVVFLFVFSLFLNKKNVPGTNTPLPSSTPKTEETTNEGKTFFDPAGDALKESYQQKPWLYNLPIIEKNYKIDYFADKNMFRVLMKIDITSSLAAEEQVNQIKTAVPQKLKAIGVDLIKYQLYYTFTP